jgi:hypothetical protein
MKSPNIERLNQVIIMFKCHVVAHVIIVFYFEIKKKMMRLKDLALLIVGIIV